MTTITAPYVPGDKVRILMSDDTGRTVSAVVTIDTVTRLGSGGYRIEGDRPGCTKFPRIATVVDSTGCDPYTERVTS